VTLAFGFWLLAFGFWLLAFGFWLLAFGFWLLAFGFWLLAFGFSDMATWRPGSPAAGFRPPAGGRVTFLCLLKEK